MKTTPINRLWLYILAVLISVLSIACNPVKKVMNDPAKFEVVATEAVRRGYCLNDTTLVHDTIRKFVIQKAGLPVHQEDRLLTLKQIDTVFLSGTRVKIHADGSATIKCPEQDSVEVIERTVTNTVVDVARLNVYKADLAAANAHIASQRKTMLWMLFGDILAVAALYIFRRRS